MKPETTTFPSPITRRHFMCGISANGLLLATPRDLAQEPVLASLRELAGGKPLIGTSVQTQFDSAIPENCMNWQFLCPKEGEYRFEPVDLLVDFATQNQQRVVGRTLIFDREAKPKSAFKAVAGALEKRRMSDCEVSTHNVLLNENQPTRYRKHLEAEPAW